MAGLVDIISNQKPMFHVFPNGEEQMHCRQLDLHKPINSKVSYIVSMCECQPEICYVTADDSVYILHNSFDGREAVFFAEEVLRECEGKERKNEFLNRDINYNHDESI